MRIDVMTLFPEVFESLLGLGIFQRAVESKLFSLKTHNFRDFARDRHHTVDDSPYGGGAGMVLKPGPLFEAIESVVRGIKEDGFSGAIPIILLTPQGRLFNQKVAGELASYKRLVLICGQYEGVDERVREHLATDEISIGDYVLTSGEIAAMVVVNAVVRLIPGVLGAEDSAADDSHSQGLLEYPHYTRPPEFRGWKVPEILLSGNHAEIDRWRREQSIRRTLKRRPDLLSQANLTEAEKRLVAEIPTNEDEPR
ncbi:MAG: tRNA (guanosine(37)-N1)-methyltransferase TrmD [Chloroflexota bacterium]